MAVASSRYPTSWLSNHWRAFLSVIDDAAWAAYLESRGGSTIPDTPSIDTVRSLIEHGVIGTTADGEVELRPENLPERSLADLGDLESIRTKVREFEPKGSKRWAPELSAFREDARDAEAWDEYQRVLPKACQLGYRLGLRTVEQLATYFEVPVSHIAKWGGKFDGRATAADLLRAGVTQREAAEASGLSPTIVGKVAKEVLGYQGANAPTRRKVPPQVTTRFDELVADGRSARQAYDTVLEEFPSGDTERFTIGNARKRACVLRQKLDQAVAA